MILLKIFHSGSPLLKIKRPFVSLQYSAVRDERPNFRGTTLIYEAKFIPSKWTQGLALCPPPVTVGLRLNLLSKEQKSNSLNFK
ncbi:MAG: hypothetical protein APF84_08045 [Gracilibacter sp. BRH_c7a]|nr:MAG: hypothetical protein APF84_08045 [Gracilibacter sp. BRH_c7a]